MNAAQQPPGQTADTQPKKSILSIGKNAIIATAAVLVALGAIAKEWDALKSLLFPTRHPAEASIVSGAESNISLGLYNLQDQLPVRRPASATASGRGSAWPGSQYRLAMYAVPATGHPAGGRFVAVTFEEEAKSQEEKIKAEGEKIKEQAKRDEENATREEAKATAEQKSAEAREQEEQKKEQEAQKRAEGSAKQGTTQAKTEEQKARQGVNKASKAVQTKKSEARRAPSARRLEVGTPPDLVEEVLHEANLPARCRPSCGLKPIVENALKATSNSPAAAAREVRSTVSSPSSGARVHFDVTLYGLSHNVVALTYSLVPRNGPPPSARYLDTVVFKTVEPTREKETTVGSFWVPVPSSTQEYFLELTVYDGKTEVASKDTNPFD